MADNSTASAFAAQWRNPTGFLSLLMIIGGPIIQSALAQLTGPVFVPICFSFGWVSYAFSTITALVGDGRLMPPTDYPCKVINLETGYARTNRSWIVGRLLRDLERPLANEAMCVSIYEASEPTGENLLAGGRSRWIGLVAIFFQLAIAVIPWKLHGDWGIFMITALGTLLALSTAALPQWRVEKLACRDKSEKKIAITTGNGSRHVVVIIGCGKALDLEDLAGGEGPRQGRPWIKDGWFVKYTDTNGERVKIPLTQAYREYMKRHKFVTRAPILWTESWVGMRYFQWYQNKEKKPTASKREIMQAYAKKRNLKEEAVTLRRLPLAFWMTRLLCGIFIILWAGVLISVLALKNNAWYLVGIGTIGMIQNGVVAAASRTPETRGIRLKKDPTVLVGDKVMDVLMDLERTHRGCGRSLLKEFFPAGLDVPKDRGENDWWDEKAKEIPQVEVDENRDNKRYDNERYHKKNLGIRYDREAETDEKITPSRGKRYGGASRV